MHDPVRKASRKIWRHSGVSEGLRVVPEETALAITYNGGTYAVMMGTPQDYRDFAYGFSLSEGVVASIDEIESFEAVEFDDGVELRMWLAGEKAESISARRRQVAGPTGCGLCGIDSISEAVKPAAIVAPGGTFSFDQIMAAMETLSPLQKINIQTRAVHAAAFWTDADGIVALREDVGRHNALDKLAGALAQTKVDASQGMVLLTSRVSVEMVQKTAAIGAPLMVSVSAPTALAIRLADAAGITLAAIARADGFEVFTHPHRVLPHAVADASGQEHGHPHIDVA
ncbi:formate dehydrogenase accessory sulfurtransferase FdhD [Tardiphaga sp. P9-11]|jgi:FdhD protein|uniref:formate dehydrogenase accessory sulfurtransferase FdhD n=1 Tax=Tardiphaga sp. P9-11 TaxID=2024614 RepID=UPI0011F13016|nr:formate dehydrogenase accessory sulfurtransferase FdhD [Tardiphaga sp. P9-11]KAA0078229.1 formate dehydrogenase accessory sulfurtransferase FdhD [Tardiphaga sp. P9-11]